MDAAHRILAMDPMPDGLFVTNDFVAAVCMQVLKENGLNIPSDIAIVGFNNDAISKLVQPNLTTIDYPGKYMGEVAAQNLIALLKEKNITSKTSTIIIDSNLIIRQSSLKKGSK